MRRFAGRPEELGVLVGVAVVLGPQVLRLVFPSSAALFALTEPPGLYMYWGVWLAILVAVLITRFARNRVRRATHKQQEATDVDRGPAP